MVNFIQNLLQQDKKQIEKMKIEIKILNEMNLFLKEGNQTLQEENNMLKKINEDLNSNYLNKKEKLKNFVSETFN